tara:strand:+ start:163 stop:582 length:420 start_codon:yes stop_codon:yes gene_type:complete
MIKAILIPTENVEEAWKLVDKHIQQALERSGDHFSSSDIKTNCLEESMQLWLGWDKDLDESHYCTAITQILKRPNSKICNIFIATGREMKKWVHVMDEIANWAESEECTHVESWARPGWERVLKQYQFKKTHVLLERKL